MEYRVCSVDSAEQMNKTIDDLKKEGWELIPPVAFGMVQKNPSTAYTKLATHTSYLFVGTFCREQESKSNI